MQPQTPQNLTKVLKKLVYGSHHLIIIKAICFWKGGWRETINQIIFSNQYLLFPADNFKIKATEMRVRQRRLKCRIRSLSPFFSEEQSKPSCAFFFRVRTTKNTVQKVSSTATLPLFRFYVCVYVRVCVWFVVWVTIDAYLQIMFSVLRKYPA